MGRRSRTKGRRTRCRLCNLRHCDGTGRWGESIEDCTEKRGGKLDEEHVQDLIELTSTLDIQVVRFTTDDPVAESKAFAHIRKRLARADT